MLTFYIIALVIGIVFSFLNYMNAKRINREGKNGAWEWFCCGWMVSWTIFFAIPHLSKEIMKLQALANG